jgi:hypothetical protein
MKYEIVLLASYCVSHALGLVYHRHVGRYLQALHGGSTQADEVTALDEDFDDNESFVDEPVVIVVDPMDVNGRYFCGALQQSKIIPLIVLSPAVIQKLSENGDNSMSHLAAPNPGSGS